MNRKKILIPYAYYYPEQCAGLFILEDISNALVKEGIESVIYVPTPTRNIQPNAIWKRDEYLCGGMIHIHRFPMFQEKNNPILRALRYFLCECYYLYRMLRDKYDIAFIDSTPPIQGLKLPIVRLFRNKPILYNVQDLFPDTLSATGLVKPNNILYKVGSLISKITFNNADKIITISNDIKNNLIEVKGVPKYKVEVVYNWVDENKIAPVSNDVNPLFDEFGISRSKFTVVYAGNLGIAQNIDIILDAAKSLSHIQFLIFGTGGIELDIRNRINKEKLLNVRLIPLQPIDKARYVYSMGNVCIVTCKAGLGGAAMPSKTWSIMSCARPVVASFDEGELKYIIENNNCGIFTHSENTKELIDKLLMLSTSPALCEEMGKNARNFVLENLTKVSGVKKYVKIIKSLLVQ